VKSDLCILMLLDWSKASLHQDLWHLSSWWVLGTNSDSSSSDSHMLDLLSCFCLLDTILLERMETQGLFSYDDYFLTVDLDSLTCACAEDLDTNCSGREWGRLDTLLEGLPDTNIIKG
jgi:hypothetical protein